MSRRNTPRGRDGDRFPRVSGDEPDWSETAFVLIAFSPRERG